MHWGRERREGRLEWIHDICDKLCFMEGSVLPRELELDLWCARTMGEGVYDISLTGMRGLVGEWTEVGVTADVHQDAMLWTTHQLTHDFRTVKKVIMYLWKDTVKYERRCRSAHGYIIRNHNMEVESYSTRALSGSYVLIPEW